MKKKGRGFRAAAKVPLVWRIYTTLAMIPLVPLIFLLIFRAADGKFPPVAGGSTDPYLFATIFAVTLPIFAWLVIDRILQAVILKRPGREIAVEMAKDLACTVVVAAAEVVLDAAIGGSSTDSRLSSSGSTTGGGGQFGGGGATGDF